MDSETSSPLGQPPAVDSSLSAKTTPDRVGILSPYEGDSPYILTEWTDIIAVHATMNRAFALVEERGIELSVDQKIDLRRHAATNLDIIEAERRELGIFLLLDRLNGRLALAGDPHRFVHRLGTEEWIFAGLEEAKALSKEAKRRGRPPTKVMMAAPVFLILGGSIVCLVSLLLCQAWLALALWLGAANVLRRVAKRLGKGAWFLPNIALIFVFGGFVQKEAWVLMSINALLLVLTVGAGTRMMSWLENRREMTKDVASS